jgi:hypothetical protein
LDDIAKARFAINAIHKELAELGNVFEELEQLSQSISECSSQTIRDAGLAPEFRQQCSSNLDKFRSMAEAMHTKITGKTWQRIIARLQWPLIWKRKIDSCTIELQSHKCSLLVALHVFQRYGIRSLVLFR